MEEKPKPKPIREKKVLAVEGKDEVNFLMLY